jgi:hypothetical protein
MAHAKFPIGLEGHGQTSVPVLCSNRGDEAQTPFRSASSSRVERPTWPSCRATCPAVDLDKRRCHVRPKSFNSMVPKLDFCVLAAASFLTRDHSKTIRYEVHSAHAMLRVMKNQTAIWKDYVYAGVASVCIPFLAMLLQTGWTFWAYPSRLCQASLNHVDLGAPSFWLGNGQLGLLVFLSLCLVIKHSVRCWMVAVAYLLG